MIELQISQELNNACSDLTLGCIRCLVKVKKKNQELWQEIDIVCNDIAEKLTIDRLSQQPTIQLARETYKKLGKEPSRYRISSEALARRILQGKNIYQINNIVDINNLISLKSLYSLGSYDLKYLTSPLQFRIGKQGETYKGIGKKTISLENLPIFADHLGAFGSPTSDSERAMITLETTSLLMIVISFSGNESINSTINYAKNKLEQYAQAEKIESKIIQ